MSVDGYFPRPEQAAQITAALSPDPIFGDPAGLFLAAPRRTGKSSFLRRDLVPLLQEQGHRPIYVDLWEDKAADPGQLLADTLADDLGQLASRGQKALGALPFNAISVGGLSVRLRDGAPRSATLSQALLEIGQRSGQDVVLIIDEAQHALQTSAGLDAMFALKAARDAMNQAPQGPRLYLVFTGSHRDKLAALVIDHKAPFFGARVQDFPRLGRDYTDALVAAVNPRLAANNQLDPQDVAQAFALLAHRPEKLTEVIREHALGDSGSAGLHQTVTQRANALRRQVWQQHESDYGALNDLQRAILRVIIQDGAQFAPFTSATRDRLTQSLGTEPTGARIQKALDGLRNTGIVWRPQRGVYALEDQDMRNWLQAGLQHNHPETPDSEPSEKGDDPDPQVKG